VVIAELASAHVGLLSSLREWNYYPRKFTNASVVSLGRASRSQLRVSAVFISRPPAGIAESPIPGKSGAITVNRSDSRGMIGFHMREVSP